MKNVMTAGAALLLTTSLATAGGIDRSGNAYAALFEDGNYVQLSFSSATPDVSGEYPGGPAGTGSTGNMADSYSSAGLALKYAVNDQFDLAVFLNQPFGANATYSGGFYDGLTADWGSNQLSVVAKYEVSPGISVFGGARAVQSTAEIAIPDALIRGGIIGSLPEDVAATLPPPGTALVDVGTYIVDVLAENPGLTTEQTAALAGAIGLATTPLTALNYSAETNTDTQIGYVVGAAYERPEIALRVSLTYESAITHEFKSTETLAPVGVDSEGEFEINMPQSLALDFQSGVAADTLVFGSIRWAEWSVWDVKPPLYESVTGDRVTGLDNDVFTYRLGVGRRINDELSLFGRVTYEKANGGEASRLAPTDGSVSYGVGGSYAINGVDITGGLEYAILGDATDGTPVEFADNTALGFGLSIGFNF